MIVLKGVLIEVCDDTNTAIGLAIFMTAFSVGNIVGPSVGGFTAFLGDQYPELVSKNSLLGKYPVLLPHIIIALGLGVGTLLAVFLLPKDKKRNEENIALLGEKEESADGPVIHKEYFYCDYLTISLNPGHISKELTTPRKTSHFSNLLNRLKHSDMGKVLGIKECWLCCLLYGTFALVDIGFNEMFPVLASTAPALRGMGMSPSQLGLVLMVVSLILIIFQVLYSNLQ